MIIKKNKFVATLVTSALLLNSAIGINVVKAAEIPTISYSTHVQSYGWQNYVKDGEMSGTSGQAKRLEAIKIKTNDSNLNVEYSTHIQGIGWQDFVSNDALSGTSGQSKRLEAIKIRLTGVDANKYDVYYRVHAQKFGWLGWAKNGEEAGTAGYGYRLEGIEIKIVEKGKNAPGSTDNCFKEKSMSVSYRTHVQNIGWQNYVKDGEMSGTSGQSKRLEAINIKLDNQKLKGNIEYSTHVQNIGWQSFVKNNALSGTSGQAKRLEAIKIRLTDELAENYDIYYRVHAQNFGWLGWAKNGAEAGTAGYGYRLEGIEIKLVAKGSAAPGSTIDSFKQKINNNSNNNDNNNSDNKDNNNSYCAHIPTGKYLDAVDIKSSSIDLNKLLGTDEYFEVKGNQITTPKNVGVAPFNPMPHAHPSNHRIYNQTCSVGLSINMRNGKYVNECAYGSYSVVSYIAEGINTINSISHFPQIKPENIRFWDKNDNRVMIKSVGAYCDMFEINSSDLTEITKQAKQKFTKQYMTSGYDNNLTEESFYVMYNDQTGLNEVYRFIIYYVLA